MGNFRSMQELSGWRRLALLFLSTALAGCGSGDNGDRVDSVDTPVGNDSEAVVAPVSYSGWHPTVTTTWQWQLLGTVNVGYDVDVYDIDLFDVAQSTIDELHAEKRSTRRDM